MTVGNSEILLTRDEISAVYAEWLRENPITSFVRPGAKETKLLIEAQHLKTVRFLQDRE